jgi:hypothetical protein
MYARVIGMRYPDYKAWYDAKVTQLEQAEQQAAKTRAQIDKANSGG